MPVLKLRVSPLQDPAILAPLARALTRITADTLGKQAEVTAVLIEDLPGGTWAVGGRAPSLPTALLEIDITAGTNTAPQKAAFIEQAFDELARHLGGTLEPASYVVVRELPATDWGWGGRTQQARRDARAALA